MKKEFVVAAGENRANKEGKHATNVRILQKDKKIMEDPRPDSSLSSQLIPLPLRK